MRGRSGDGLRPELEWSLPDERRVPNRSAYNDGGQGLSAPYFSSGPKRFTTAEVAPEIGCETHSQPGESFWFRDCTKDRTFIATRLAINLRCEWARRRHDQCSFEGRSVDVLARSGISSPCLHVSLVPPPLEAPRAVRRYAVEPTRVVSDSSRECRMKAPSTHSERRLALHERRRVPRGGRRATDQQKRDRAWRTQQIAAYLAYRAVAKS